MLLSDAKRKRFLPSAIFWLMGLFIVLSSGQARAQVVSGTEVEATEETAETAERIRVLEAQKIRQDERASLYGGTGLVFTRTGVVLPRKHFNVSGFFNWGQYTYLQGWRKPVKLEDPRHNDYDLNIVADYGLTQWAEVSMFMDLFLQNEHNTLQKAHPQFMDRRQGLGATGINGKFRLMDLYKDGLGITTTVYLRLPSPMANAHLTSRELGYGVELNVSLKMVAIADWLDKFRVHGNLGYGHFDYFDTGLMGLYQDASRNGGELWGWYRMSQGKYRGQYSWSSLFKGPVGDIDVDKLILAADHYTGSLAIEYRPILGLTLGFELVGYRMIKFYDDNLQVAPYVTYTFRQIPFSKRVRKDILTASLAGNFGGLIFQDNRSSPQTGVVLGLTYHTDLKFNY